jgi:hypothetical protein
VLLQRQSGFLQLESAIVCNGLVADFWNYFINMTYKYAVKYQ